MIVAWTTEAVADLISLRAFISDDNPAAAQRLVTDIIRRVESTLAVTPGIGRPGRVIGTREFVVSGTPFIIPYRVEDNGLQVLRVYHGARLWPEVL
jgi:toxin ParE1/3/4